MKRGKEIMLVAGEASGDMHGADLVKALLRRDPHLKFYGVGGEQLQQTPFEAIFNVDELTGMGLLELAGNVGNIWKAYRLLCRALETRRPDLLILIDFPEFNLRLARLARKLGVRVLYYVGPQIWAWRRGRIRQIARNVDCMAVVFPFEAELYRRHGIPVQFVGHPLLDIVRVERERDAVLRDAGLAGENRLIVLLPGSRQKEVASHLPVMARAAAELNQIHRTDFLCVRASTVERTELENILHRCRLRIPIVEAARYEVMNAADLVWAASGTATLETALLKKPMVVVYRVAWLTYVAARLLVRVKHIGIANIVAGRRIVPELVQSEFTPRRLVEESRAILDNPQRRETMVADLAQLRAQLGTPGAAHRVADLATSLMSKAPV